MKELLNKTRKINRLLQASGHAVMFKEMCEVLSECIAANVYVSSAKGIVLGYALVDDFECDIMKDLVLDNGIFPKDYNDKLLRIDESMANLHQKKDECVFKGKQNCIFAKKITTIIPIKGGGKRLGNLIIARYGREFADDDLILAEYGATVVGMEILRIRSEKVEEEARKKVAVQIALNTLSYSEQEAVEHIFEELEGEEGLLVASKIADRVGITRSVIVNALRKFESAGVIEARSLGMKGTYIKVLNDKLLPELERLKNK